eukprot:scaffold88166_cov96-Phaeocystis_antarctica.AAC.1
MGRRERRGLGLACEKRCSGSAVHGAAASACCTDAVLSGASGPALVKGDGHWESHSAGKN